MWLWIQEFYNHTVLDKEPDRFQEMQLIKPLRNSLVAESKTTEDQHVIHEMCYQT